MRKAAAGLCWRWPAFEPCGAYAQEKERGSPIDAVDGWG